MSRFLWFTVYNARSSLLALRLGDTDPH